MTMTHLKCTQLASARRRCNFGSLLPLRVTLYMWVEMLIICTQSKLNRSLGHWLEMYINVLIYKYRHLVTLCYIYTAMLVVIRRECF